MIETQRDITVMVSGYLFVAIHKGGLKTHFFCWGQHYIQTKMDVISNSAFDYMGPHYYLLQKLFTIVDRIRSADESHYLLNMLED